MLTLNRFECSLRLRRSLGMQGYGVYIRLAELIDAAPEKAIPYEIDDLVYDMREDAKLIQQVAEEYGLFDIADGKISDRFNQSPEALDKQRKEQVRLRRIEAAHKAAEKRNKEKKAEKVAVKVVDPQGRIVPFADAEELELPNGEQSDISKKFDEVREAWNDAFKRTRRVYLALTPDAITWHAFTESVNHYTIQDYKDAFAQARKENFAWQFKDVLKLSNLQRLLSAFEIEKQQKAAANPQKQLDFETREMIEYGEARGWNWSNPQ